MHLSRFSSKNNNFALILIFVSSLDQAEPWGIKGIYPWKSNFGGPMPSSKYALYEIRKSMFQPLMKKALMGGHRGQTPKISLYLVIKKYYVPLLLVMSRGRIFRGGEEQHFLRPSAGFCLWWQKVLDTPLIGWIKKNRKKAWILVTWSCVCD